MSAPVSRGGNGEELFARDDDARVATPLLWVVALIAFTATMSFFGSKTPIASELEIPATAALGAVVAIVAATMLWRPRATPKINARHLW